MQLRGRIPFSHFVERIHRKQTLKPRDLVFNRCRWSSNQTGAKSIIQTDASRGDPDSVSSLTATMGWVSWGRQHRPSPKKDESMEEDIEEEIMKTK